MNPFIGIHSMPAVRNPSLMVSWPFPFFSHVLTLAHMPRETLGRENKEDPWISKPWMHKAAVYFKSRVKPS